MPSSDIPAAAGRATCDHEHLVEFYETEQHLIANVTDYLVLSA